VIIVKKKGKAKRKSVTTRVVYNDCYGGFSLSNRAFDMLVARRCGIVVEENQKISEALDMMGPLEREKWKQFRRQYNSINTGVARHDPDLLAVIDELGMERASGSLAQLKIAEIEGDRYIIREHAGVERVVTPADIRWIRVR
jgi:hypothetical protein